MKKIVFLLLLLTVALSSCKKDDPVIVEYTVSFDSQGGSGLSPVTVPEGGKVTKPGDPVKEGETFLGWYKEKTYTSVWDFDTDVVTQNLSLYARWAKPEQKVYTVSFETNGGSEVAPLKIVEGDKLVKPSDPTKTDCSFLGWYTDAALTEAWQFDTHVVKEDVTLYARWSEPGEVLYTVSFDTDGGSEIEAVSVVENEKVLKPANPTKVGYEFNGWFTDLERLTAYDFESLVAADVTLYAKWLKSEFALVDFNVSELAANGIEWDAATKTLDITKATGSANLPFNVSGVQSITTDAVAVYDMQAKSIGGISQLVANVKTVDPVDGKLCVEFNVPEQKEDYRVPLEATVKIINAANADEYETITIKSRPNYNGTEYQPVLMKTKDDKLVFWAPVNAGATEMPVSVSGSGNVTKSCGQLFQWGRKSGVSATTERETFEKEKYNGENFPTGEAALANMSEWDDWFILSSDGNPNTKYNWLRFAKGEDNPDGSAMQADAWYQKLWNKGTEASPVKTEYDPCPKGWRVPTRSEWEAIDPVNNISEWNNGLLHIKGAKDVTLVLPAVGNRASNSGESYDQGIVCNYWTSSVPLASADANYLVYKDSKLKIETIGRAVGFTVRCIQE